jgi:multiple antibiotic resistance protein
VSISLAGSANRVWAPACSDIIEDMTTLSAAVLLFLVMDPIGNIPLFVSVLEGVDTSKRRRIIIREHLIAFVVLVLILFSGRFLMNLLRIQDPALGIAGGIILFLIALRMIFAQPSGIFGESPNGEPLVFPLAVPFIAGPSAMTTVLLLATREPARRPEWIIAIAGAWVASLLILLPAMALSRWLGQRVLTAFERLMGMILTVIAVQMFLTGLQQWRLVGS